MTEKPKFITIYFGEAKDLDLAGNDLLVYSLIYGFSQDGESDFHGSISFIQQFLNIDRRTVIRSMNRLLERGLLQKERKKVDGRLDVRYWTDRGELPLWGRGELPRGVGANCHGGSGILPPNNKIDNIKDSTLTCRVEKFADEVRSLAHAKGWEDKDDIEKFISYWSEPNQSKTKMRFEMEKTWDTSRRINTWKDRSSRENGKRMPQPELPTRPFRTVDDLKK